MRTMLLTSVLVTVFAGPAAAQSLQARSPGAPGPGPKPTIGLAGGVFGTVDQDEHNDSNLLLSGTIEIPFNTNGRVRIEGARASLGSAHVAQMSMGLAAVREPGAPVSGYLGIGAGLYRASFDRAPALASRAGVHFYGGAELTLSKAITFDAELGVHALAGSSPYLPNHLLGESVFRLKFAL
jgi:hypothetical protein